MRGTHSPRTLDFEREGAKVREDAKRGHVEHESTRARKMYRSGFVFSWQIALGAYVLSVLRLVQLHREPARHHAVRGQVALYGKGGRAVLDAIRSQNFDTLARRPSLGKRQKGRLILSALMARLRSAGRTGGGTGRGCA